MAVITVRDEKEKETTIKIFVRKFVENEKEGVVIMGRVVGSDIDWDICEITDEGKLKRSKGVPISSGLKLKDKQIELE